MNALLDHKVTGQFVCENLLLFWFFVKFQVVTHYYLLKENY